jgi:hypothetical protein
MVHEAPEASVAPQVVVSPKSLALAPAKVIPEMLTVPVVLFVNVNVCAVEGRLSAWFPKAKLPGDSDTDCSKTSIELLVTSVTTIPSPPPVT